VSEEQPGAEAVSEPDVEAEAVPEPEPEAVPEPEPEPDPDPDPDPMELLRDRIEMPDDEPEEAAAGRQATLIQPAGSFGRLEKVAAWFATVQGQSPPHDFARARVVLFAADHGVAAADISTYPVGSTEKLLAAMRAGTAPVNVLADIAGATLRLVDVGVDGDEPSADRIRRGSGRIDREDALTPEETQAAIDVGVRIADEEVDAGADLLILGDVGIANTAAAAVLVAVCLGSEPTAVTGRGSGIGDAAWMRKVVVVRDALRRGRKHRYEAADLLSASGGADLAAMTGFLLEASARKTPVLLDGVVSAAAAVVARDVAYDASSWWFASHRTEEPAHIAALESLGMEPLLDLGIQLGQGTGGLIVLPLIRAAVRTLSEVATRNSIGLSREGEQ
jgi:nicotinate-nucleotide--dimethylbenzimidazole phosphoribosyltransferase